MLLFWWKRLKLRVRPLFASLTPKENRKKKAPSRPVEQLADWGAEKEGELNERLGRLVLLLFSPQSPCLSTRGLCSSLSCRCTAYRSQFILSLFLTLSRILCKVKTLPPPFVHCPVKTSTAKANNGPFFSSSSSLLFFWWWHGRRMHGMQLSIMTRQDAVSLTAFFVGFFEGLALLIFMYEAEWISVPLPRSHEVLWQAQWWPRLEWQGNKSNRLGIRHEEGRMQ